MSSTTHRPSGGGDFSVIPDGSRPSSPVPDDPTDVVIVEEGGGDAGENFSGEMGVVTLTDSPLRQTERSDHLTQEDVLFSDWLPWEELARKLQIADLIEFRRVINIGTREQRIYTHWAIYVGAMERRPRVIHLSTEDGDFDDMPTTVADSLPALNRKIFSGSTAEVRGDPLEDVAGGDLCRINNLDDSKSRPLVREVVVHRATLKLGSRDYHILNNNCEHFVKWCRYGHHYSGQATMVKAAMVGSVAIAATGSLPVTAAAVICYSTAAAYGRQMMSSGRRLAVDVYKAAWRAMRSRRMTAQRRLTYQ